MTDATANYKSMLHFKKTSLSSEKSCYFQTVKAINHDFAESNSRCIWKSSKSHKWTQSMGERCPFSFFYKQMIANVSVKFSIK